MKTILFVCKGNICRSPLAHGLLTKKLAEAGVDDVYVDSAGTGDWHIGKQPDSRTIAVAAKHNLDLSDLRSRQFQKSDFKTFDTIITMDNQNTIKVMDLADQEEHLHKIKPITSLTKSNQNEVDDPYHHGERDFDQMYSLLDDLTNQLVANINQI